MANSNLENTKTALLLGDILVNTINGKKLPSTTTYTTTMTRVGNGRLAINKSEFSANTPFYFNVYLESSDGNTLTEFFPDINWSLTQLILDFGKYYNNIVRIVYVANI